MREAAAYRSAVSRLNVADPREGLAKQRHSRGDRVIAFHDALSRASPGTRDVLLDCDEYSL